MYIQCKDAEDYRLLIDVIYGMRFWGRRARIVPMLFMGAARGRVNSVFVYEQTVDDPATLRKDFDEATDDDVKSPRIEAMIGLGRDDNHSRASSDGWIDHAQSVMISQESSPLEPARVPSCMPTCAGKAGRQEVIAGC